VKADAKIRRGKQPRIVFDCEPCGGHCDASEGQLCYSLRR
jgi:hypothetical protein